MGVPVTIRELRSSDWEWIKARAAPILCEDTDGVVALRGSDLIAAAVFDSWSETSCLAHIVIEDPFVLRHGFLETGFRFVFEFKKRILMTGLTPADNPEALRLNKKMGFREVYRIPEGCKKGVDYVLQELRRDECRWLHRKLERAA
jgi:hypothetical protein